MTDRILIPHGNEWLALSVQDYQEAVELGAALRPGTVPNKAQTLPRLLTADEMAAQTNIPASWWREAAKRGEISSIKLGKYRRFPASLLSETDEVSVAQTGSKQGVARLSAVKD
jgi:excisionase family DNA binding protein